MINLGSWPSTDVYDYVDLMPPHERETAPSRGTRSQYSKFSGVLEGLPILFSTSCHKEPWSLNLFAQKVENG